jgi:SAM-dependent methyltransferase
MQGNGRLGTQELEQLQREFNRWALDGRGDSMERGHRPIGEQAIEQMGLASASVALDIGCGNGWGARLMAGIANDGMVIGVDVSNEMIRIASDASRGFKNSFFCVSGAGSLPFKNGCFTHAFSMESLYYYPVIEEALSEIARVMAKGSLFCAVVDLFVENPPTHYWVEKLQVPVHLLSAADYARLFERAGFIGVSRTLLKDPTPLPATFASGFFKSRQDYILYREIGSLMITGRLRP